MQCNTGVDKKCIIVYNYTDAAVSILLFNSALIQADQSYVILRQEGIRWKNIRIILLEAVFSRKSGKTF